MKIQEVAGRTDHLRKIRGVLFTPVAVEELLRGRIQQKAKLSDGIDPRVVVAEHGWWFPEIKDEGHGWDIANVNILTDNAYETLVPCHRLDQPAGVLVLNSAGRGFVVEWKNPMKATHGPSWTDPVTGMEWQSDRL
jgi:anaerobic selenocysteine-containing dehydrogenase